VRLFSKLLLEDLFALLFFLLLFIMRAIFLFYYCVVSKQKGRCGGNSTTHKVNIEDKGWLTILQTVVLAN
jgi:hypothetical protein